MTDLDTIRREDEQTWEWRYHFDQTTSGATAIIHRRELLNALDVAAERIATLEAELDTERRTVDRMADTIMTRDAQVHQLTQDRDRLITELQTIRKVVSRLTERLLIDETGATE